MPARSWNTSRLCRSGWTSRIKVGRWAGREPVSPRRPRLGDARKACQSFCRHYGKAAGPRPTWAGGAPAPTRANDKLIQRNTGPSMSDSIHLKLPDGSTKEVPKGTTAFDVAKSISPRLADAALAAKTDGNLIDLTRPLDSDTDLRILTDRDLEALEVYRHSSAHLLAAAVLELFPETKLGHGPATENGFFYDFYRETPFTPEDMEKIEKKMQELAQQNLPYAREFLPRQEGLEKFKGEGD